MADNDYLCKYRQFFENFANTLDPSDQLPVKVAGYNLTEEELAGDIIDWTVQYLTQKQCPASLVAPLVQRVLLETRTLYRKHPTNCGFRSAENIYQPLKLMQSVVSIINDLCSRYLDNSILDTLPVPNDSFQPPMCSSAAVKNIRRKMEDRHVCIPDFHGMFDIKDSGPASYYCVLDGHAGVDAATYGASHLQQYLAESSLYPSDPKAALREAFLRTDHAFVEKCQRENLSSGTTAVVALLRENWLYIGWVGDSQALLVKQGRVMQVVLPHKPSRKDEKERIEDLGGCVMFWGTWRVSGQLAVSRAIGDCEYKPYVTGEPDIVAVPLDGQEDFLILACDGLWDFVTEDQAALAVYRQIVEHAEDPSIISLHLVQLAKQLGSTDNISVIIVFLKDPKILSKEPLPVAMDLNIMDRSNSNNQTSDINTNELNAEVPLSFTSQLFDNETDVKNQNEGTIGTGIEEPYLNQDANQCLSPDLNLELSNGKNMSLGVFEGYIGPETDIDTVDDVQMLTEEIKDRVANDVLTKSNEVFDEINEMINVGESALSGTEAVLDNVADSDSEDEWNYYTGNQTTQSNEKESILEPSSEKEIEDMSSQLNPDAAPFVPVSPSVSPVRPPILDHIIMDDVVIAQSPRKVSAAPMENFPVPTLHEFEDEISSKPGDLEVDLDMLRPESSHSGSSNQEMNLKETSHGDEKLENGLLETECPTNFNVVSQLNPYIESFKPQDPMSMSFYQDKNDPSDNPFDDELCQIKNKNPFDLNAVQLIPDSDEEIGVKDSFDDVVKYEGLKENEMFSNNVEGDLMSPVNELASPDDNQGVDLLKHINEISNITTNISEEVAANIISPIDDFNDVSTEHNVDLIAPIEQDVNVDLSSITKEIQSAQNDIISFINEAVSVNNEFNENDEHVAPISDTVKENLLSMNELNALEANLEHLSEGVSELSNNMSFTELTNHNTEIASDIENELTSSRDKDLSPLVENLQNLLINEAVENIPIDGLDIENLNPTLKENVELEVLADTNSFLPSDDKLKESVLPASPIEDTLITQLKETEINSVSPTPDSQGKFENVDQDPLGNPPAEQKIESFESTGYTDEHCFEIELPQVCNNQAIVEATQKMTEEVTSLLQEVSQPSKEIFENNVSEIIDLDNAVFNNPIKSNEIHLEENLNENANNFKSCEAEESVNKLADAIEQVLDTHVVDCVPEPAKESPVDILKEVSDSLEQKLEEPKVTNVDIVEEISKTMLVTEKEVNAKKIDKPTVKKSSISAVNKKPISKTTTTAPKTTTVPAKPTTTVKRTVPSLSSKTTTVTKTTTDKIGTRTSSLTAKSTVGVKAPSARSPATLRASTTSNSTSDVKLRLSSGAASSPRSTTTSKTTSSPRTVSSVKVASTTTSSLAKPSAEKKPLTRASLTNGATEKTALKKTNVSLSAPKPTSINKTGSTTKPPTRPSTAPTVKTTVPPRVPLTKPRVSSAADKVMKNTTNLAAKSSIKATSVTAPRTTSMNSSTLRKTETKTSAGSKPIAKTSTLQKLKPTSEKTVSRTVTKTTTTKTAIIRPTKASVIQNGDTKIIVKEEITFTKEIEPLNPNPIVQDTTLILIDSSTD